MRDKDSDRGSDWKCGPPSLRTLPGKTLTATSGLFSTINSDSSPSVETTTTAETRRRMRGNDKMARRIRVASVDSLISEIDRQLNQLKIDLTGSTLRQKVLQLVELNYESRCLGVSVVVADGLSPTAAMDRIQGYLQRYVGEVIDGAELDVVSGISEYARRVRELRIERGFRILTGASPDEESGVRLKSDQYMLTSNTVDSDLARRWHVANRIRKGAGGAKAKILQFLKENVGHVVTTEELAYVSGDKSEFGRRTRELRTEEGYAVATRFTGRPDLNAGEYVLLSLERVAEVHDRHIPSEVQREVYERDNSTCQQCGWNMVKWTTADARILELHHLTTHATRGSNSADNLLVLCSYCHDEVHAGRIILPAKLR